MFIAKYDSVEEVNNGIITVKTEDEYKNYMIGKNTNVYIISNGRKNTELKKDSCDTIIKGDRLLIISKEGITDEIYVWKNC